MNEIGVKPTVKTLVGVTSLFSGFSLHNSSDISIPSFVIIEI
jgi:hypothetical protein